MPNWQQSVLSVPAIDSPLFAFRLAIVQSGEGHWDYSTVAGHGGISVVTTQPHDVFRCPVQTDRFPCLNCGACQHSHCRHPHIPGTRNKYHKWLRQSHFCLSSAGDAQNRSHFFGTACLVSAQSMFYYGKWEGDDELPPEKCAPLKPLERNEGQEHESSLRGATRRASD